MKHGKKIISCMLAMSMMMNMAFPVMANPNGAETSDVYLQGFGEYDPDILSEDEISNIVRTASVSNANPADTSVDDSILELQVKSGYASNKVEWKTIPEATAYKIWVQTDGGAFTLADTKTAAARERQYFWHRIGKGNRARYKVEAMRNAESLAISGEMESDVTGEEGLRSSAIYYVEFEDEEMNFDGNRLVDLSEQYPELNDDLMNANGVTAILKFKPQVGAPFGQALFAVKDQAVDARKLSDQVRLNDASAKQAALLIAGNSDQKMFRFALPQDHANHKSGNVGDIPAGEWHTMVFHNSPKDYRGPSDKIFRMSLDGQASGSFAISPRLPIETKGGFVSQMRNVNPDDMQITIGGMYRDNGVTVRNGFRGQIKAVIITDEIISDDEAVELSQRYTESNSKEMFNANDGNTWVFTGSSDAIGKYGAIKTGRNYSEHFEEAVRDRMKTDNAVATQERFVFNTAQDGLGIVQIVGEYEERIGKYRPKAVHVLLGREDAEDAEASADAVKALVERNASAGRYTVIGMPIPTKDAVQDQRYQTLIEKVGVKLSELNSETAQYLTIVHHFAKFANIEKSEYLNLDLSLNAKGHFLVAKQTVEATTERILEASDIKLNAYATEGRELVNAAVSVEAGENTLNVHGVLASGLKNPEYELILDDGRKITGSIAGDTFSVSGILGAQTYQLQIFDMTKRLPMLSGAFGQTGALPQDENLLQSEIANRMVQPTTWLFLGDELTQASRTTSGYDSAENLFEKYLYHDLGRNQDVVLNTAVSRTNLETMLSRKAQRYDAYNFADIVFLQFGLHDALFDTGESTFKTNLATLIDDIKANNAIPVLRTPFPLSESASADEKTNIKRYVAVIRELATEKNVLFIDHFTDLEQETASQKYYTDSRYYYDGNYPNARGNLEVFKGLVDGLALENDQSDLYHLKYLYGVSKVRISHQPKVNTTNHSISVDPAQLADLGSRGDIGKVRVFASTESQTYVVEGQRHSNGVFDIVTLDQLPTGKYTLTVEADLYDRATTLIFATRELDLSENIRENVNQTILNIEEVSFSGQEQDAMHLPKKANVIKSLDSATVHFRYRITDINGGTGGNQALFALSNSADQNSENTHAYLSINPGNASLTYELKNTGTVLYTKTENIPILKGTDWHNISLVYKQAGGMAIYVDGKMVLEDESAPFVNAVTAGDMLCIGGIHRALNQRFFKGEMDIARVYDRALDEDEIAKLHAVTAYLSADNEMPETAVKTDPIALFYDNYSGSRKYRIPSLITTKNGTVIAAIDKRYTTVMDNGNIDTAIRRSTNNGKDWTEIETLLDIPGHGGMYDYHPFFIDPVMFQDEETGKLFLMVDMYPESGGLFNVNNQVIAGNDLGDGRILVNYNGVEKRYIKLTNRSTNEVFFLDNEINGTVRRLNGEATDYTVPNYYDGELYQNGVKLNKSIFIYNNRHGRAADLTIDRTSYIWMITSDNDGETWSTPRDITYMVKKDWMRFLGLGPGVGYQIRNGEHKNRFVVSVYSTNAIGGLSGSQASAVIYSDDKGETWKIGESVVDGNDFNGEIQNARYMEEVQNQSTEAQVVEVGNEGVLKMYSRNTRGNNLVRVSTSRDGGETWDDKIEFDKDVPEVGGTQLSIIKYPQKVKGKDAYIISNPGGPTRRKNGMVRLGFYNEETDKIEWKHSKLVEAGEYAYSCLTVMQNGHIGLHYEAAGTTMKFTSFSLDWLMYEPTIERDNINIQDIAFEQVDNTLNFKVQLDQNVLKYGQAGLRILVDGTEKMANYVSGEDSNELVFSYPIGNEDREIKTIGIEAFGEKENFIGNANHKPINAGAFVYTVQRAEVSDDDQNQQPDGNGSTSHPTEPQSPEPSEPQNQNPSDSAQTTPTPETPPQRNGISSGRISSSSGGSGSGGARAVRSVQKTENGKANPYTSFKENEGSFVLADAERSVWKYTLKNGETFKGFANITYTSAGKTKESTYHFNENGEMTAGWFKDSSGKWYYFNREHNGFYGEMIRGFYKDAQNTYYLSPVSGELMTGWQLIEGKWYYFQKAGQTGLPEGALYQNSKTPDGYRVDADGVWIP